MIRFANLLESFRSFEEYHRRRGGGVLSWNDEKPQSLSAATDTITRAPPGEGGASDPDEDQVRKASDDVMAARKSMSGSSEPEAVKVAQVATICPRSPVGAIFGTFARPQPWTGSHRRRSLRSVL